tara:strand:- start:229 stop:456 length:228 start_codon:yes stop_codon:yes gene_type:complete
MGVIGYIAGSIYLLLSFYAILTIKGMLWALVATFTGAIAFFPIWAYFFLDFSDTLIWILFFITIVDAVMSASKKN